MKPGCRTKEEHYLIKLGNRVKEERFSTKPGCRAEGWPKGECYPIRPGFRAKGKLLDKI